MLPSFIKLSLLLSITEDELACMFFPICSTDAHENEHGVLQVYFKLINDFRMFYRLCAEHLDKLSATFKNKMQIFSFFSAYAFRTCFIISFY